MSEFWVWFVLGFLSTFVLGFLSMLVLLAAGMTRQVP